MGAPLPPSGDPLRAGDGVPPAGLYLHIASPTYYEPVQGIILSAFPYTFETHWIHPTAGPHVICTRRAGSCRWCNLELRWNAAVEVMLAKGGGRRLVKISEHAARTCASGHFRSPARPTRGWGLSMFRHRGGKAGRLSLELTWKEGRIDHLPAAADLAPIIAHLFHADRKPIHEGGEL